MNLLKCVSPNYDVLCAQSHDNVDPAALHNPISKSPGELFWMINIMMRRDRAGRSILPLRLLSVYCSESGSSQF